MNNVLVFGMILFDSINGDNHIGGPPLNVAIHMARLGQAPLLISAVGNDELGSIARSILMEEGVSTEYIITDTHETGKAVADVDNQGIPVFDIKRDVAYDYITLSDDELDRLDHCRFDMIYFGTVEQRSKVTHSTLEVLLKRISFKDAFYDVNLRDGHYTREVIEFSLLHTSIFKLNDVEIMLLGQIFDLKLNNEKEIIDWLFDTYRISIIIVTRGGKGASVFTPEFRKDVQGIKVAVKDTVGSGDAFSAGFIVEYMKSGDVCKAVVKGNELGAYTASHVGAVPKMY